MDGQQQIKFSKYLLEMSKMLFVLCEKDTVSPSYCSYCIISLNLFTVFSPYMLDVLQSAL